MTGTIAILTKPFAIKAEGKAITEEGKAQRRCKDQENQAR